MKAVLNERELGALSLFRGLSPAQLNELSDMVFYKEFPADRTVLTINEPGEAVYILLSGTVKVSIDRNGADVILTLCGPGEVLGEISVMDGLGHSANVVTLDACRFLTIGSAAFCEVLHTMPPVTYNLATMLARRLRRAGRQTEALAALDICGRVAGQLLDFAHAYGVAGANGDIMIPIRLTQTDFAALIGATRESVNKALAFYKRNKCISIDGEQRITIHQQDVLVKRSR